MNVNQSKGFIQYIRCTCLVNQMNLSVQKFHKSFNLHCYRVYRFSQNHSNYSWEQNINNNQVYAIKKKKNYYTMHIASLTLNRRRAEESSHSPHTSENEKIVIHLLHTNIHVFKSNPHFVIKNINLPYCNI